MNYETLKSSFIVFLLVVFVIISPSLNAEIKLPAVLSDGTILQRDTEFQIKAWAKPGEKVTLNFKGKTYRTKTEKRGNQVLVLPPQKAGKPYGMEFRGKNKIKVCNILFGDFWLCSGQSNMVLSMERVKEKYPDEIANADFSEIRHLFFPTKTNLNAAQTDLPRGTWKEANSTDLQTFSATAYFFAKKIYSKYKIPIGFINASVGEIPIESWISEEGYKYFPDILKTTESSWVELRFAQFQALSVPNTVMAVAIDLGEWNDIHPFNKKDLGVRLALGAFKVACKENIVHSGPLFQSAQKVGNKMVLTFSLVGSGLTTNNDEDLRRFEIAGSDGRFVWANANIVGDKVEVWFESTENPVKVRYAWADNPRDANFYNKEGLPASPFQAEKIEC